MVELPENVREALEHFVREALQAMKKTGVPALVVPNPSHGEWQRLGDDNFVFRPNASVQAPIGMSTGLTQLDSYSLLRQALSEDPWLGRHLGVLVGSSSRSLFDLDLVLALALLDPMLQADPAFEFQPSAFASACTMLAAELMAREIPEVSLVPLSGFEARADLDLGDGIVVRQLRDDEIQRLLPLGVLPDRAEVFGRRLPRTSQFCLATVTSCPKLFGDEPLPSDYPSTPDLGLHAERFVTAVRLAVGGALGRGPAVRFPPRSITGGWGTSYEARRTPPLEGRVAVVGPSEASHVLNLYQALDHPDVRTRGELTVALRRFRDARLRLDAADVLLDLAIAAEALFMSDADRKTEITQRLSLRLAAFTPITGSSPGAVRRFVKAAYDARSRVVHGAAKLKLKRLDGSQTDLDGLVDDFELVMRQALTRAIRLIAAGQSGEVGAWDQALDRMLDKAAVRRIDP